jgi:hypothetical protein
MSEKDLTISDGSQTNKVIRGGMQIIGGLVPFAGGLFSAAAGAWSEQEQEKVNSFFREWVKMASTHFFDTFVQSADL